MNRKYPLDSPVLINWYHIYITYITSEFTHGRAVPRWYTRPEVSIIELTPAQRTAPALR